MKSTSLLLVVAIVTTTSHVVTGVKEQSRSSLRGEKLEALINRRDNGLYRRGKPKGGPGNNNNNKGANKASDGDDDDDNDSGGIIVTNVSHDNGDVGEDSGNGDTGDTGGDAESPGGDDTGFTAVSDQPIPDKPVPVTPAPSSAPVRVTSAPSSTPIPATPAPITPIPAAPDVSTPGGNGVGGGFDGFGTMCFDRVASKTWDNIKLTPGNAIAPFVGVDFACGIGTIKMIVDRCTGTFEACAMTNVQGFDVATLQIGRGKMFQNGPTVVDFSRLLDGSSPAFDMCVTVPERLYLELVNNPDEFYVNASPGGVGERAVRGQLLQGFRTKLGNEQTVDPFNAVVPDASGMATVTFENGGTIGCFDATVNGFDPALAHIHFGQPGMNGPRFLDFSSVRVTSGRFLGCIPVAELGLTPMSVCELLADGYLYYFDFHLSATEPGIFTSIRGQMPRVNLL